MTTQRDEVLDRVAALLGPAPDALPDFHRRMRRRHRNRKIGTYAVITAITAIAVVAIAAVRNGAPPPVPADPPSRELGIFAPVAGRWVVGSSLGIDGIDPASPSKGAVRLTNEPGIPLGWSSDGRRLLIVQWIRGDRVVPRTYRADTTRLIVLHADGSESLVTEQRWIDGAAISPDGSDVVFAIYDENEIYMVDAGGGRPEVLFEHTADGADVSYPTFSPDGAKIAFVVGGGDYDHRVWVMNADGSDARQILANQTTMGSPLHVEGLAWSPTGDRIAIMLRERGGTYTFAPDGSGFTAAGTRGWYLSPDGSRFASGPWHPVE